MRFLDLLRSSFSNLRRRKLRSFLTIFAVVIGASLVSLLVSLGIGTREFLSAQITATMPPDVVLVASNQDTFELGLGGIGFGGSPEEVSDGGGGPFSLEPLTQEDIDNIEGLVGRPKHVEQWDAYVIFRADSVRLQGSEKTFRTHIMAVPEYQVQTTPLVAGTHFTDSSQWECIIANQYLDSFGFERAEEALGQEVFIQVSRMTSLAGLPGEQKEYKFKIVGISARTLRSTQILIPIENGKEMARLWIGNDDWYDEIPPPMLQLKVDDSRYVNQVAQEVKTLGLGAFTADDALGTLGNIFGIINAVLGAFGLITLGVASLGIINTLIMAIYERTREIGVMKAVGASRNTIRLLFTTEGVIIGFLGGVIGVGIGYGVGLAINTISHVTFLKDFQTFNISTFPWWLIVGVIALSTIIALAASLYPAHRASRLDPIEALRYE